MPTSQPRYQVTDTGRTRQMLDRAAAAWPELAGDRKALLLRAIERGTADLEPADAAAVEDLMDHAGEWVAIKDDKLLIASQDAQTVVDHLNANDIRDAWMFVVPASLDAFSDFGEHGGIG